MQYQISLTVNSQAESLERVLRVVRHRGFELNGCQALQQLEQLDLQLLVTATKPISLLSKQLAKLFCVDTIQTTPIEACASASSPQVSLNFNASMLGSSRQQHNLSMEL